MYAHSHRAKSILNNRSKVLLPSTDCTRCKFVRFKSKSLDQLSEPNVAKKKKIELFRILEIRKKKFIENCQKKLKNYGYD